MANLNHLSQTLIRTTASSPILFSAATPRYTRFFSVQPKIRFSSIFPVSTPRAYRFFSYQPESRLHAQPTAEMEAKVVERIEDLIHALIVKRCKPDWLPLVPGASYWVPPRKSSYGVSDIVNKFANSVTEEEYLSLVTLQGWPSAAFYIQDDAPSHTSSTETSHEDGEVKSD